MARDVERLRKLADVIEEHPDEFDMRAWWRKLEDESYGADELQVALPRLVERPSMCGTTACIAGWAVFLWPADVDPADTWESAGARILGLDNGVLHSCDCGVEGCTAYSVEAGRLFGSTWLDHRGAAMVLRALADGQSITDALRVAVAEPSPVD